MNQFTSRIVGPRVVGGRYVCGYWGREYTVLDIAPDGTMRVQWDDGVITCHTTAWDRWDARANPQVV